MIKYFSPTKVIVIVNNKEYAITAPVGHTFDYDIIKKIWECN